MNQMAQITVVIPVFNRVNVVERTLDSIATQTARPLKLILVDNNSTDGSFDLLHSWADSHRTDDFNIRVISQTKPGAAAARNAGLALVDTEWTMFFDSDDTMRPAHIAHVLDAIRLHPDADLIGWDLLVHSDNGKTRMNYFEPDDIMYHNIMHGSLATLRYCARTICFRKAGGWCEQALIWDDIELGCRLLQLSPRIVKVKNGITVDVYEGSESISGPTYSSRIDQTLKVLDIIHQNYPVRSHVGLKEAILLGDCYREGYKDAATLFCKLMQQTPAGRDKLAYSLAYYGRRLGLRGWARILKPILSK